VRPTGPDAVVAGGRGRATAPAADGLPRRGRLDALDGLRALAVGVVFLHHASMDRFPGGFFGVDLFFVLSGYLITTLLLREHEARGSLWLGGFYLRRLLRLAPALVALVVVTVPVAAALGLGSPLADGAAALTYLTDVYGATGRGYAGLLPHTWSLAVEEQFYLVWPAVLVVGLRRGWPLGRLVAGLLAGSAVVTALAAVAGGAHDPRWLAELYRAPVAHVPELFCGVLLAVLVRRPAGMRRLTVLANPAVPVVIVVALGLATLGVHESLLGLYVGGFTGAGLVMAALVGHTLVAPGSWVSRLLARRPLVWVGARSYGIYLWHYPALKVLALHLHQTVVLVPVGAVVTVGLAELSWRAVEVPFLRRKEERYSPHRRPAAQPA
jgi:peptidoglycan/LPS O-acetylase OafA/YrhL